MKSNLLLISLIGCSLGGVVQADYISGDMTLRDSIYLYGKEIDNRGSKQLIGVNCDVFQVVFDLDSGYSNLITTQGDTLSEIESSTNFYPDTIKSQHKMFSYALYKNKLAKKFIFYDENDVLSASKQIGQGTFFAYCYSTKPEAFVYLWEGDKCQVMLSNGDVRPDECL